MKQNKVKYTQLLGKSLAFNDLAAIYTTSTKNICSLVVGREKKEGKGFKKIGSKKIYGSTLLVEKLLNDW